MSRCSRYASNSFNFAPQTLSLLPLSCCIDPAYLDHGSPPPSSRKYTYGISRWAPILGAHASFRSRSRTTESPRTTPWEEVAYDLIFDQIETNRGSGGPPPSSLRFRFPLPRSQDKFLFRAFSHIPSKTSRGTFCEASDKPLLLVQPPPLQIPSEIRLSPIDSCAGRFVGVWRQETSDSIRLKFPRHRSILHEVSLQSSSRKLWTSFSDVSRKLSAPFPLHPQDASPIPHEVPPTHQRPTNVPGSKSPHNSVWMHQIFHFPRARLPTPGPPSTTAQHS